MQKAKMRIKALNTDLTVVSDRLVSMDTEFSLGPQEAHKGPLCLEVTLRDKQDIDLFKVYLDKLVGNLPISERKVKEKAATDEANFREEFIKEIKEKFTRQDKLIEYLRERNFVFLNYQTLSDYNIGTNVKKGHTDYQFMIRKIKEAKDPANDKYDSAIIFGIKLVGEKSNSVKIYLYNEFSESLNCEFPDKSTINYKKIIPKVFPEFMIAEERLRWDKEHRALMALPKEERQPSKFYSRWLPAIKLPTES